MFLFNWFRQTPPAESTDTKKNEPCAANRGKPATPEMCTIQKDEYDALLRRLRNLETMMNALPLKPITPELSPVIPRLEKPTIDDSNAHHTPFQIELENKLRKLREKMGASHGFGLSDFALTNLDDLNKLEQSVMEQSIMYMNTRKINRPPTPNNMSDGNTPSSSPVVPRIVQNITSVTISTSTPVSAEK
jgi:hypothetical protein